MFDNNDIHSLALVAWKEARGEGLSGCIAVMLVCDNRSRDWKKTIHDVIFGRNQFTSMSVPSDPEFNLSIDSPRVTIADIVIFNECMKSASDVLCGSSFDVTHGAHYYANLKNIDKGGWFERNIIGKPSEHPVTVTINHQTFFV